METIMSERTSEISGIADFVARRCKRKECFLDEINNLIDRKELARLLRQQLKRIVNAVENPTYPSLSMLKVLLLQHWHCLDDTVMEVASYGKLSFGRFVDISLDHDAVPDATTFC
jgi:transposase, IS5 family